MSVSYKRLWKLLIDREMTKTQLIQQSGITTNAMARMGKGEDVRVETLVKICAALECSIDDIIEILPDDNKKAVTEEKTYG